MLQCARERDTAPARTRACVTYRAMGSAAQRAAASASDGARSMRGDTRPESGSSGEAARLPDDPVMQMATRGMVHAAGPQPWPHAAHRPSTHRGAMEHDDS